MGKEIPRNRMMARVERNTEIGMQTNAAREEEDLKRAVEELMEPRSKLGRNNLPQKTTIVLGLRNSKRCRGGANSGAGQKMSGHAQEEI